MGEGRNQTVPHRPCPPALKTITGIVSTGSISLAPVTIASLRHCWKMHSFCYQGPGLFTALSSPDEWRLGMPGDGAQRVTRLFCSFHQERASQGFCAK